MVLVIALSRSVVQSGSNVRVLDETQNMDSLKGTLLWFCYKF